MDRVSKQIDEIILHCSASGPRTTVHDIRKWHKSRGWKDIGYHYVIESDGGIRQGRDWQKVGAHCEGHNEDSIGICLVGGHDGKTLYRFSDKQLEALKLLIEGLFITFGKLAIHGHYEYSNKSCPCFNVEEWLKTDKVVYAVR